MSTTTVDARPGDETRPATTAAGAHAAGTAISRKAVAAAVAGNALEFYDFVIYAYFAVYIGRTFFPVGGEFGSLMLSLATFGVGFFTRPLGGVLIGAFADKAGRKPAMLLTVALITFGTLGMAATPS
jgi:MFS family permease